MFNQQDNSHKITQTQIEQELHSLNILPVTSVEYSALVELLEQYEAKLGLSKVAHLDPSITSRVKVVIDSIGRDRAQELSSAYSAALGSISLLLAAAIAEPNPARKAKQFELIQTLIGCERMKFDGLTPVTPSLTDTPF